MPYRVRIGMVSVRFDVSFSSVRARSFVVLLGLFAVVSAAHPVAAQTPAQVGQWEGPLAWPVVAIHMMLQPNGQVLFWDGPPEDGGQSATLWDPASGAFTPASNALSNIFCAGQAFLADGRAFIAGGHITPGVGLADGNVFDELTGTWTRTSSMAFPRWYPTVTKLADGRMLVTSGSDSCEACIVGVPEIYNPRTNTWTQLTGANLQLPLSPQIFALPDGRVLSAGSVRTAIPTRVLDLASQTWSVVDGRSIDGHSVVQYQPGKLMKSGSAADVGVSTALATNTAFVLDMTRPSPQWQPTGAMGFRRAFHTLTSLPDGTVLVTGGGSRVDR